MRAEFYFVFLGNQIVFRSVWFLNWLDISRLWCCCCCCCCWWWGWFRFSSDCSIAMARKMLIDGEAELAQGCRKSCDALVLFCGSTFCVETEVSRGAFFLLRKRQRQRNMQCCVVVYWERKGEECSVSGTELIWGWLLVMVVNISQIYWCEFNDALLSEWGCLSPFFEIKKERKVSFEFWYNYYTKGKKKWARIIYFYFFF